MHMYAHIRVYETTKAPRMCRIYRSSAAKAYIKYMRSSRKKLRIKQKFSRWNMKIRRVLGRQAVLGGIFSFSIFRIPSVRERADESRPSVKAREEGEMSRLSLPASKVKGNLEKDDGGAERTKENGR